MFAGLVAQGWASGLVSRRSSTWGEPGRAAHQGLTLPFMSYGGSAVMINLAAIAVVLRVDYENRQLMHGGRV